jgi:serine-type D-Ala-D-Ala carboxypeptidase (penicillin-binding protein 5/6)
MKRIALLLFCCVLCSQTVWAARAKVDDLAKDPYISALVIDADTGKSLFEDHAEAVVYPASVLKLMDLLVILEQLEQGKLKLDEMVQVTKEAAHMGGSQVYLDPKEQFSVEDLLYALAVQSANDAAVVLATHVAGSTEGFVAMMNRRAKELGMKDTHFYSVHGLPPAKGQKPDETTARDLALLGRELAKRPAIFEYTGTKERPFRGGKFILRNHNHLLGRVNGCDGFKTGYFENAGFSIVATAKRRGVRIIAIVMGSKDRKIRDAKAAEFLAKGFSLVPPKPEAAIAMSKPVPVSETMKTAVSPEPEKSQAPKVQKDAGASSDDGWSKFFWGLAVGVGLVLLVILAIYISRKKSRKRSNFRGFR